MSHLSPHTGDGATSPDLRTDNGILVGTGWARPSRLLVLYWRLCCAHHPHLRLLLPVLWH